nr:Uncharacterised protein [Klebsiella pneumoniae]
MHETTIFSNEVSLAVNFQNVTVVAFDFGFDHAVSSHVACFLRRFDRAGFTHVFDCQLDVAIRFSQRFCNPSCLRQYVRAALLPGKR